LANRVLATAHVPGWRSVVYWVIDSYRVVSEVVHEEGGVISAQLAHYMAKHPKMKKPRPLGTRF
jgi:2,4-dienoyl-CoA reductase-like NADH-dependent reductase (Old Yellow Enzyme family)